jgi:hypothetical protein
MKCRTGVTHVALVISFAREGTRQEKSILLAVLALKSRWQCKEKEGQRKKESKK